MTNNERLREIEDGSLKTIELEFLRSSVEATDMRWLISKVRQLTEDIALARKQENHFTANAILDNALGGAKQEVGVKNE